MILALLPTGAWAQGYAGLGSEAEGYAPVTAPAAFEFPRDHGPHPDFRIEWWYLTANLTGADGAEYGLQWTLFRQALRPDGAEAGWASRQLWMGHAGLTTAERHFSAERFARGGIGQAGVELTPFRAWIDEWAMTGTGDGIGGLTVSAAGEEFGYRLEVATEAAPVPQGEDGFSVKSEAGQASYYYSQPFYRAEGVLEIDGREVAVEGRAWLDREWSSQPLGADQEGWDWFSLHLESGAKIMAFRLRGAEDYHSGTWIEPDGRTDPLGPGDLTVTPLAEAKVDGRRVPVEWRVEIPERGFAVDTEPLNPQSFMATTFPYWEGPIRFEGSHSGRGYLEMTGYE